MDSHESLNLASKPSGTRFRVHGPSYAGLARFAASQRDPFDGTALISCSADVVRDMSGCFGLQGCPLA